MRYIKETERTFIDMGNVKSHETIFSKNFKETGMDCRPVVKLENKSVLPGGQERQNFAEGFLQVVRIVISGTIIYFDTLGNRVELSKGDLLSVTVPNEFLHTTLYNADEATETDLLEVWLRISASRTGKEILLTSIQYEQEGVCWLEKINSDHAQLRLGSFSTGATYSFGSVPGQATLLVFLISGSVCVAGQPLHYRDTLLLPLHETIMISASRESQILTIVMSSPRNYTSRASSV